MLGAELPSGAGQRGRHPTSVLTRVSGGWREGRSLAEGRSQRGRPPRISWRGVWAGWREGWGGRRPSGPRRR